ncbi:MAG TPA: ADP-ribosylglycohydrolase family protein [Candidatus Limnocylindrales bacterium]|nr:ADP-ribosylglycohydrolase family protein [Candidatus Limnocylindrales bacterium]
MTRLLRTFFFLVSFALFATPLLAQEANPNRPPAAQKAAARPMRELEWDTYLDKVQGAWMGKMIGVTFGQPWEFEYLGTPIGFDITDWPLSPTRMKDYRARADNKIDYGQPIVNEADNQKIHINKGFIEASEKEHPSFGAPDNDDIYINLLFLYCLRRYGIEVTPVTVAHEWDAKIRQVWHANDAGLANIRKGILPPLSGNPRYNLHADDIDFQIESDIFGMIAPGMPQVSNRFGDRMGHIMNYGDGVYGGMFISAMYTQAFFAKDVRAVVENGLKAIPAQSLYAQLIRDVIRWHDENPNDWLKTWHLVQTRWGEVDHCPDGYKKPFNIDAKLNGGYVVIGLLYGNGDFYKTMNLATRCGQDADCNPANAAGILGTLLGARGIPAEYREPLHNTYWNKTLAGLPDSYEIDALAGDTAMVGLKVLLANGGEVATRNGKLILRIPVQEPVPPANLEQIQWKDDTPVLEDSH